ncbi:MAG: diacylglycerol kinase family protein [Chloroflexi bacterium]|nr:diacylglycerol kinase family protein [Chloroflexota bacterium]
MNVGRLARSFQAALAGVRFISETQLNWRIHLAISLLVIGAGTFFRVSPGEWALLILTMGGVLALEAMNTAVECVVDALDIPRSPTTKHAKDAAAASVLIGAVAAIGVAVAVFLPRLVPTLLQGI